MKKRLITPLAFLFTTVGSLSLYAAEEDEIRDDFQENSSSGWYIPSDHNTGILTVNDRNELIIETLGQQDWCTLNREIRVDFEANPILAVKIDELPANMSFHLKVERLANANDYIFLEAGSATHPGNYAHVYCWNVKELLSAKSLDLFQDFKIQIVFEHISGVQTMAIDWFFSDPYFVKDEFDNHSVCGWTIPSDHNTGTLTANANKELIIETLGQQDWCMLFREFRIDFAKNPELAVKINELPSNVSFFAKVERMANADDYVFLDPANAKHAENQDSIYIWDVKTLLSEKSIDLFQDFKIQLVFERISGIQTMVIDWVRSHYAIENGGSVTGLDHLAEPGDYTLARIGENEIAISGGKTNMMQVKVFDVSGRCCLQVLTADNVNITHLIPGIYILTVQCGEDKAAIKFIK